jgi:hypothetical protein
MLDTPYRWMLFFPPFIPLYHGYIVDTLDGGDDSSTKFMYVLPMSIFILFIGVLVAITMRHNVAYFIVFALYMVYNSVHASMILKVMNYLKFSFIGSVIVTLISFTGIALIVEPILAIYIKVNFKKIERRLFPC